jgi:dCMP deaminase
MKRKTKIEYYLDIAKAVSERSTCIRRKYGAVIVKNDEIIATGYNGSPRGSINCCDINKCQRSKIPKGFGYESCFGIHAEMNCIISAARRDILGGDLYLYCYDIENGYEVLDPEPCGICKKMIQNAGIKAVYNRKGEYKNDKESG